LGLLLGSAAIEAELAPLVAAEAACARRIAAQSVVTLM